MDDYIKRLMEMNRQSGEYITKSNIKDRIQYPYLPTIVVDDFYETPDLVRDWALDQEFFKGNRGSWPGLRTELLHNINSDLFFLTSKKLLDILQIYGFTKFDELQTGFQLIDETYGRGWVHDDDPKLNIAGIIYLSPDPLLNSGTTLYEDQTDFNGDLYTEIFMNDVLVASDEERSKYKKYREEQLSHFVPTVSVDHLYNRCVIFDPRNWHSADNFFGNTKESARLTQVFFIRAS